jgi:hypothetical protein
MRITDLRISGWSSTTSTLRGAGALIASASGGVLKNQEQVGGRSVAEWLGALDVALTQAENPENVMSQFFTQDPAIASMSRLDQAILRRGGGYEEEESVMSMTSCTCHRAV